MSEDNSQEKNYDRGSALSIFSNDRMEDFAALVCAFLIALFVYLLV